MELLQLKYFKTVAEIGKISDAARTLFISAPALSTSIARLEKELGVQLFDRASNRVTLNQQGQIMLRYVNQVFASIDCARTEIQQSLLSPQKHVRIASMATIQLVDLITAFSEEYPGFTLQCTSINSSALAANGLSVQHSFLLAAEESVPVFCADKLESVPLFDDFPVVVVHPDHPFAQRESVELKELTGETIFMPLQNYPLYNHLQTMFHENGIPMPTGNAYSHLVTQQMVSKGLGISFATCHTGRTITLPLCYVPIVGNDRPWRTRLYWSKEYELTEDEKVFRDFVIQFYQSDIM